MKVRFKADFTVEADDIDTVKKEFAKVLLGYNNKLPEVLSYSDGWCIGDTKYWHYVQSCWRMKA